MSDPKEYAFKAWFIKEVQAKRFAPFSEIIKEYERLDANGALDSLYEKWDSLQDGIKPVEALKPPKPKRLY